MSERGSRRRLSDAGLFFITLLITLAMCALWVVASAATTDPKARTQIYPTAAGGGSPAAGAPHPAAQTG